MWAQRTSLLLRFRIPTSVLKNSGQSCRTLFILPGPDAPKLTTLNIVDIFTKDIGTQLDYSREGVQNALDMRRDLVSLLPKDRNELPPRRMQDSLVSAVIPLSTNRELRERYVTAFGTVRVGRLLEDLDIFAVRCCYKHILNPKSEGRLSPYSVVTGLVDSIHFSKDSRISTAEDIRLTGHVTWVGKSSMEVFTLVDQRNESGQWKKLTEAVFVLVARNSLNSGPAIVNPLVAETQEEKVFLQAGEDRNNKRKLARQQALTQTPPTVEETDLMHRLFLTTMDIDGAGLRSSKLPPNTNPMNANVVNTLILCHPQYRNRFNKVFGGFTMRQAFELAFNKVYLYAKKRPRILNIDDITFRKPVEIGSILRFRATVGYVEKNFVHIPVIAEVLNPETGARDVTNVFQFTFFAGEDPIPQVMPNTYQEAIVYLDSRRHFLEMMTQCENF